MARGPRLVLLGKQGAGKGTQSARLAEHYDVVHLSTGDLFRLAVQAGTALGLEAKSFMDRGELVPDATVVGVVEENIKGGAIEAGFILDGFPRNDVQAEALHRVLADHQLDAAVDLDVPDGVVLDRLAGRRVCESCGTTYHDPDILPARAEVCDVCGEKVVQRDDDTPPAIRRRLELYAQETVPVLEFYRERGLLVLVDGVGDSMDVFDRLVCAVETHRQSSPA